MSVLLEGEAERLEQSTALVVVGGGGHHSDVHATHAVDAVLVDLVEHRLLGQAERVVALAVELLGRQAAEVADAGKSRRHEAVEELPHAVATERGVRTDRHALAQLELRDGLAGLGDQRLLTGDGGQVADRALDELGVLGGVADTHVHDDLDDAGNLHDVGVAELLLQLALDLLGVPLLEAGHLGGCGLGHVCHRSLPERTATRVRTALSRPLRSTCSTGVLTRAGFFSVGSTIATLLTWIAASWTTRPPVRVPRADWPALVWRVTRLTPSTSTRWVSGYTAMTLPCLALSLPVRTWTRSPFLIFIFAAMAQSTSGASEMIFMNFFSRSSRPTGPKMRVPRGSPSPLRMTAAFSSNLMYEPSCRRRSLVVRTMTALTTSPFFTFPPGIASLTVATMVSPMPAYRRPEPPRTRMHRISLAPVLSATRSRDSC